MSEEVDLARRRLQEMIAAGGAYLDLGLASLLVGAEEEEGVDVDGALRALDELAEAAQDVLAGTSELQRVASLVEHLFVRVGFRGNKEDYGDPRNSHLHQVLERKVGLPITLSILLIEVARRVGIELHGVGFPTHFLVGLTRKPGLYIDAFNHGRILTVDECKALLHVNTGGVLAFDPRYLEPTSTAQVLARVSRNLKTLYLRRESYDEALRASERIVMLSPGDWIEVRERGVIQFRREEFGSAIADLSVYLSEVPDASDRGWVVDLIEESRRHLQ
jgi:regulator of sirC expression with transglutaminase-like and TPR domain